MKNTPFIFRGSTSMVKRSAVTFLQQDVQQYAGTDTAKRTPAVRDCLSPLPACIRRESAAKQSVPCRNQPETGLSAIRHAAYCFALSTRLSSSAEVRSGAISGISGTAEMRWELAEYYGCSCHTVSGSAGTRRFVSAAMTRHAGVASVLSMTYLPGAYQRPREARDIAELSMMIEQLIRDGRRIFGPDYNPFKSRISETRGRACSHAETNALYRLFMEKVLKGEKP